MLRIDLEKIPSSCSECPFRRIEIIDKNLDITLIPANPNVRYYCVFTKKQIPNNLYTTVRIAECRLEE